MFGKEGAHVFASPGTPEHNELGVIPRTCELLWRAANQVNRKADNAAAANPAAAANSVRVKLFVSFMEIYLEQIRDLGAAAQAFLRSNAGRAGAGLDGGPANAGQSLSAYSMADGGAPATRASATALMRDASDYVRTNLDVMEDSSGMTFVKDLTYMEVTSAEDMLAVLRAGYALRSTAATAANDVSSRSHTVFTVSVVTYRGDQQPVTGRLNLIDLAGSERQSRSGAEGQRLKEMSAINKSLTALGKVVMTLAQGPQTVTLAPGSSFFPPSPSGATGLGGAPHVPFRDSKLTRILKDSLTGNSFTCLLACLNPTPDNVDECSATLQFAVRCSSIATAPQVNVLTSGAPEGGVMDDLITQVAQLKDELEVTHAHYQKLLESVAGPSWRNDPGPLERAPGGHESGGHGAGLDAFSAMLSTFGKANVSVSGQAPGGPGGGTQSGGTGAGGGGGFGAFGFAGGHNKPDLKGGRSSMFDEIMGGKSRAGGESNRGHASGKTTSGAAGPTTSTGGNARVSVLEAQIRKLETQLAQARSSAQQYEERLTARKEEMDMIRERMAGKEHAQFGEIKKLRQQVSELTKALDAERVDSANKVDDARRRAEEESARLMKDIDVLRAQLSQVTGSVGGLVEKHSAAIALEKRQREMMRQQVETMMQKQVVRGSEEHRAQVENLKQQSTYFLTRQSEQLSEVKAQLDHARASAAVERDILLAELDHLATYAERVTELVRRMESGVVPVHDRGNGVKAFKLPARDRPPRLEGSRLTVLKERNADLQERLVALSAATATGSGSGGLSATASAVSFSGPSGGGGGAPGGRLSVAVSGGNTSPLGSTVDLDALKAQVEAELKAQVTAQVLGDMKSDKTVEYIRELETAVGRYRSELQVEKKRNSEMVVALRSVQRIQQRPESPLHKAMAAHSPQGTLKMAPSWGMGHSPMTLGLNGTSRPATAGLASLSGASPTGSLRRPSTSLALTGGGFRENGFP
ncbi:hypothetical protein HYH03_016818 [Edaphochlamys debaryana]|uniref:Kinesin-like protein n=1 Tax=Edaphochlamys debaryana TaxID=47281 RepID=A0A836BR41_9CHLO|nr:hypothetical protein HYH03_016818 [Edaphochlamys debaryana]|eukprot:KAG2484404.1 hypothetical protein HYH03_016818 [Edaphochlamys debaryana]